MSIVWKFGNMPAEKIEIFEDDSGQFRCRLEAADGETITVSRGYNSRALCMRMVQKAAMKALAETGQSGGMTA